MNKYYLSWIIFFLLFTIGCSIEDEIDDSLPSSDVSVSTFSNANTQGRVKCIIGNTQSINTSTDIQLKWEYSPNSIAPYQEIYNEIMQPVALINAGNVIQEDNMAIPHNAPGFYKCTVTILTEGKINDTNPSNNISSTIVPY